LNPLADVRGFFLIIFQIFIAVPDFMRKRASLALNDIKTATADIPGGTSAVISLPCFLNIFNKFSTFQQFV